MLLEYLLEHAKYEFCSESLRYSGYVPDLPDARVEGATVEECRAKLGEAVASLLAVEAERPSSRSPRPPSVTTGQPAETRPTRTLQDNTFRTQHPEEVHFSEIIYEKHEWVARVIINRPEVYNVYSGTTLHEMTAAFRDAARDDKVAVLVLTGAGDEAFCTGSDLQEHSEQHLGQPQRYWEWMGLLIEAHEALRRLGKPTIARINGIVAGGGNEWNLACDLAVAAEHARFVQVETTVGTVAASGATQWLPLVIGERRAREMLLACEPIGADKALMWGLVNEVVPYDKLDLAVDTYCSKLVDKFPDCTRFTRQQLNFWKDYVWDATIERARTWLALHFAGPEAAEGINALGERRRIDHRGIRSVARHNGGEDAEWLQGSRLTSQSRLDRPGHRSCPWCGAQGIPRPFEYCGYCGARIG